MSVSVETVIDLIRSSLFLWNGFNFLILAHLYYFGYQRIKSSRIIASLCYLNLTLGLMYTISSFLPIVRIMDRQIYLNLVPFTTLLHLPIGIFVQWFREESLRDQDVEITKAKVPLKIINEKGVTDA